MPLQNRVTPEGAIIATPERGLFMGNRGGRIHRPDRTLTGRRWASKAWITCRLEFRSRQRQIMSPTSYTELFFLDEATALAAGHRPCAECRRADFLDFTTLWADGPERARAGAVDAELHGQRLAPGGAKRRHAAPYAGLADGVFVNVDGVPCLVLEDRLLAWTPGGYGHARARPAHGTADMLTPPAIAAVLARGYRPVLHGSAAGRS